MVIIYNFDVLSKKKKNKMKKKNGFLEKDKGDWRGR